MLYSSLIKHQELFAWRKYPMVDKSFELMEKMYIEFSKRFASLESGQQKLDSRIDKLDNRMDKLDNNMSNLDNSTSNLDIRMSNLDSRMSNLDSIMSSLDRRMSKVETTLEHDIKANLQALHERTWDNTLKLKEHNEKLESIENKIDILAMSLNSQDKRIELVESRRKKVR
jgi:chromosome segregation ATPase